VGVQATDLKRWFDRQAGLSQGLLDVQVRERRESPGAELA
jgi:hypothetical protein